MSKLAAMRAQWAQAAPMTSGEFEYPKDGKYTAIVDDVIYTEKKQDSTPCDPTFVYTMRIDGGEYNGMKFRRYQVIKSEKSLGFLKGDLNRMGLVVPADPDEVIQILKSAIGCAYEIEIKTRIVEGKDYRDINILSFIKKSAGAVDDDPFDAARYDKVPF
jgi:hypothetical protein